MELVESQQLFGRDTDGQHVVACLDTVAGRGRAIGLVGEPGVGKSALQAAVARQACTRDFTILSARGSEAESHLPFASLHQLIRPVLDRATLLPTRQRDTLLASFGMAEATGEDPFLGYLAVLELISSVASHSPVLLSLDDLHWMDGPSVEALCFVARRIASENIVMVGSVRPQFLQGSQSDAWEWFEVNPLDRTSAAALLAAHSGDLPAQLRERLLVEAGGNPLALLEFARAVRSGQFRWSRPSDSIPMTARLEHAFALRAEDLDPAVAAVLLVAALNDGDDLDEVLAAASVFSGTAIDPSDAQRALETGMLTSDGQSLRFHHPLARSSVWRTVPLARRREAHAALAQVLSAHPDRVAWHRASSATGPDETIAADLARAAGNARGRGAVTSAVAWMERAASLSPDEQVRAQRLIDAAEIGFELGRFDQFAQLRSQLDGLLLRARDQARLAWLEGVFHDGSAGEPDEVRRLVGLAEIALQSQDLELATQLLLGAARRTWWSDPGSQIRRALLDAADRCGLADRDPRLLVICATTDAHTRGAFVTAQLDHWPPDSALPPEIAGALGLAAFCLGDFTRARAYLSSPVDLLRTQGRLSLLAQSLALRSWVALYLGLFDTADSAQEAVDLAEETAQPLMLTTARIAVAAYDAVHGREDDVAELLADAERTASSSAVPATSLLAGVQLTRGLAALGSADFADAYRQLRRMFDPADPAFHRVQQVWAVGYFAEAAVPAGHRDEARHLLMTIESLVGTAPSLVVDLTLAYARAVLADTADAEPLYLIALTGPAARSPWHRARAQLAYGTWLRRQRRIVDSRNPLHAARTTFDSLGLPGWAARADDELRATGEAGWQPTAHGVDDLTPQETQIAELAAQGLSNRAIAQRLFLSHRTVGSHLYRIFPKLGITSRAQLAVVLHASNT